MSAPIAILGEGLVDGAQRPLLVMLLTFMLTFALTRLSTRLARAGVLRKYRPGSIVTAGGLHIHHAVIGVVVMFVSGSLAFAVGASSPWIEVMAWAFGAGAALTLDEFALILHLEDVYWTGEGRASIDAVILGGTFMTLLLTGLAPRSYEGIEGYLELSRWGLIAVILAEAAFVIVCYLKGKLFVGTIGIFVPPVAVVGALRLAKPTSPWAKLQYTKSPGKMKRAARRDEGFHRRWRQRKHFVWDLIGGKPHLHLPHRRTPDDGAGEPHAGVPHHGSGHTDPTG